ncbi:MAG: calcium/proton exchanger [Bryobacteraceae bacterium]
MLNWLLVFAPVAIVLHYAAPGQPVLIFASSALAIVPLAGWLGKATEHLAARTSEGIGGLLNATFGNAAELIISLAALKDGLLPIVKASLTGSIIGNLLLVTGAAVLGGGLRYKTQQFNAQGARVQTTMLTLSAIAFVAPAAYHHLSRAIDPGREHTLSVEIASIMLLTYALSLLFSLHTHKQFFAAPAPHCEGSTPAWSVARSLAVLGGSTAMVGWISEILVGSVGAAASALGMSDLFVGVVVVAIIGNAAEHSTAVAAAMANRMDLALGIAVGASIQVALFVAPVLVLASYWIAPRPMDLAFTLLEVFAIVVAVTITNQIASDGESNWLEGVQLLAVYLILGVVFFFMPV